MIVVYAFMETTPLWALKNVLVLIAAVPVNSMLKMMYASPRPFWEYKDIDFLDDCSTEFGNPSGHAMFTFGCYIYAVVTVVHVHKPHKWITAALVSFAATMVILVWFDRIYLGKHSWN